MRVLKVFIMLGCFALAGLNVWAIAALNGGALNYIAVAACLATAALLIVSLARHP